MDRYDELTLTADARVLGNNSDEILNANSFGVEVTSPENLKGGSIEQSANMLRSILGGHASEELINVGASNTALGMSCFHPEKQYKILFEEAKAFISSGHTVSIDYTPRFTEDGSILYFGVSELKQQDPRDTLLESEKVKVDVWHHKDKR